MENVLSPSPRNVHHDRQPNIISSIGLLYF